MFPIKSKHLIFLSFARITIPTRRYYNPRTKYNNLSTNTDIAKSNSLISRLTKNGRIIDARKVFDEMPERDVMTWMAVINGYVKCGMVEEARELFHSVDAKKDVVTWTAMINGYIRAKRIEEAERLFSTVPDKNVVCWNTMIEGYAKNGRVDSALDLFDKMPEKNVVSWNMAVSALARSGRVDEARRLFDSMPAKNVVSWTAMVTGFLRNGRAEEARAVFEAMPAKNVVSWNAMIDGLVRGGDVAAAWNLFDEMPERDPASWAAMVARHARQGQNEEALRMFSRMLSEEATRPDEATLAAALSASGNLAGLAEGRQVHQMTSKSVHRDSEILASALINMYSKCGELGDAEKVFGDGLARQSRDLVCWNAMISGFAHHGRGSEAIELFDRIREFGLRPNGVTYVGLLSACSHAGLVEEGLKYFDELVNDESIEVKEKHYSCFVDLCGRAGKLRQAFDFVDGLKTKPSLTVWGALLSGCIVYGDAYVRNLSVRRVLEEGHDKAGLYSLLSSVYSSSGEWKEAEKVRVVMKEQGLKKQPGCSWIGVGNTVHVFVVSDESNRRSETLCSLLCDLHEKMKVGFVSSCDIITWNDDL